MDVASLADAMPRSSFVHDPGLTRRYAADVTGRFIGDPLGVARPADVTEVAEVLRVCNERGVGVVPQGGNTGLVGGAIAGSGQVVLSL
jgi:FAD/FMN-containing dehydrogenase